MNRIKPAGPGEVRLHNRRLVLQTIENNGPISRADLAKTLGMSEPTVSSVVEDLMKRNLVLDIGPGESLGGRRPTLLRFNPEAGFVAAISLTGESARMGLSDLAGNLRIRRIVPWRDYPIKPEDVGKLLQILAKESQLPGDAILGACIAAPGVADASTGIVRYAPSLTWHNISLGEIVEKTTGLRVLVENDVNAAALAEKTWGSASNIHDFALIAMDEGIGAGIILGGELFRGHRYAAGEIGFAIVERQWLGTSRVEPSEYGSLERYASASAMTSQARAVGILGAEDGFDDFMILIEQGNGFALEIQARALDYLAAVSINIVAMLDLEALVIGGRMGASIPFVHGLRERINASSPLRPEVISSRFGMDAPLLGALSLVAQRGKEAMLA